MSFNEDLAEPLIDGETYELDSIRTEYHPHTGKPPQVHNFSEFQRGASSCGPRPKKRPWEPFNSRLDFDAADLALEACLSVAQTERLIKLIRRGNLKQEEFTLRNFKDIRSRWEAASHRVTPFTHEKLSLAFHQKEFKFDLYYRPLWDWICDLLRDPKFGPHFVFDAQRLSKYDGKQFVRFFDEPWTANSFWDHQSKIPPNAKPLAFILYADKAKLSSFGRAKGYPVIARCANLPVHIRNGEGIGGGRVVGWLPIPKEDPEFANKPGFVNFKNAVWHESFLRILHSLAQWTEDGGWVNCWDNIARLFYPLILILAADYEEQMVMALLRGLMSGFPCPICLVPKSELSSAEGGTYPHRTSEETQALITEARAQNRIEDKEKILKSQSLRDVDSSFRIMKRSHVFPALSFDRLHYNHEGLFGDHLFVELQRYIKSAGRAAIAEVDNNFSVMPRWRNLNHFDEVMSITFSDGSKHQDIAKLIVFAAHSVLDPRTHKLAYLLLRCIRLYVEFEMYAGLEVHTTETIEAGRHSLAQFSMFMEKYIKKSARESDKNWNFPKKHLPFHLFDDIEAKGATRNFGTEYNEKMHGPIKESFLRRTNFKNIAGQILRFDHWNLVSEYISSEIATYDAHMSRSGSPGVDEDDVGDMDSNQLHETSHVHLGAKQKRSTLQAVEEQHIDDEAFRNFQSRLSIYMTNTCKALDIPLPTGARSIEFLPDDEVTEYRFLKVQFESSVDWRPSMDYLRCSPCFHNVDRHDCIIVKTDKGFIFARLAFVFTFTIGSTEYPTALIHPYDAPCQQLPKDKHFHFWRVKPQPRARSCFISVRSIIRGAALTSDPSEPADYLVIDTVDSDMFLRMKKMHSEAPE
ncbi:hypothetical protein HYDPIDRAFT_178048 [Hydnomerulius pinastri MD-312]|uniref:Uncharacterized protein n=1 Tax=Hydnomerulius pinastri MD-312 TaxID=994086 RepID=A0A0C9UZZ5_9AGAM|nr:hypothetical protein HYDPIDRAFT_178048 [Hydnomerulius pinastri MD-312]